MGTNGLTMGERITALRKGRGMTQEQLAERLSVTRQSVSKWELDQATPEVGCAVALCDVFGVSLDYLIRGTEVPPITEGASITEATMREGEEDSALPSAEKIPQAPSVKPLSLKGYVILFGVTLLLGLEICLHILPFGNLFNIRDIGVFFLYLYPVLVPIPALYLVTRRWCYATRREAMKHLWKVTGLMTIPVQLLLIGGCLFQLWFFTGAGNDWLFWHTSWETLWYQSLVGEIWALAVQIPLLVCFHEKKWVCYLSYGAAWFSFPLITAIMGEIPDLLTAPWMGYGWALFRTAIRLGLVLLALISQVIVYRLLPKEEEPSDPPEPRPVCPVALFAVMCALGIPAMGVGMYYGLSVAGLSLDYVPAALSSWPVLLLFCCYRKSIDSAQSAIKSVGLATAVYFPLMFISHWLISFFVQVVLTTTVPPVLTLPWPRYLGISFLSALVGWILPVPAMVALRKHPLLCGTVYAVAAVASIAAAIFLPSALAL